MSGVIKKFTKKVTRIQESGQDTEHSYRSAIEGLFDDLGKNVSALNEPRQVDCGAPDLLVKKDEVVVGHIEAKKIGVDLRRMSSENTKQQIRYREALSNLIYTNCHDWDFYVNGILVDSVSIASFSGKLTFYHSKFNTLENLLMDFISRGNEKITKPKDLAIKMAGKAKLIKNILHQILKNDHQEYREKMDDADITEIYGQFLDVKKNLIKNIEIDDFADIYAETVTHGMVVARLYYKGKKFTRQNAVESLPQTNPFLRSFFGYIAGPEIDNKIKWIIDDLALMFSACDVDCLMEGFNDETGREDPFLHFYETFLKEYSASDRKIYGVWHTPQPIVEYIVNAVDEVLRSEFGLEAGLADTSKITVDIDIGKDDDKSQKITERRNIHRVQILDPAAGTGTFLVEVIRNIVPRVKNEGESLLSSYIDCELMPRLHGMEVRMASYAVCFAKIDMTLRRMGYTPTGKLERMSVYLTDALAEGFAAIKNVGFAPWLTKEAKGARSIKSNLPIMCVIGNPPYLSNTKVPEGFIGEIMKDYKKEPNSSNMLDESNTKWLNDLYVQFIRLSSHFIEKKGEGIMGLVTNHSYINNTTFRGMRWHMLKTFDYIWILDLHGDSNKREYPPNGKKNENVFDIKQGVAIIIAVKTGEKGDDLADVMHGDIWGTKKEKFDILRGGGVNL